MKETRNFYGVASMGECAMYDSVFIPVTESEYRRVIEALDHYIAIGDWQGIYDTYESIEMIPTDELVDRSHLFIDKRFVVYAERG